MCVCMYGRDSNGGGRKEGDHNVPPLLLAVVVVVALLRSRYTGMRMGRWERGGKLKKKDSRESFCHLQMSDCCRYETDISFLVSGGGVNISYASSMLIITFNSYKVKRDEV